MMQTAQRDRLIEQHDEENDRKQQLEKTYQLVGSLLGAAIGSLLGPRAMLLCAAVGMVVGTYLANSRK